MSRVLVWFSCGAASAVAAKLAIEKYGNDVVVVYCDTLASEHPDNSRFMLDVSKWLDKPVEVIKNRRYEDIDDVFRRDHYMAGINGARCTRQMKRLPRIAFQHPDDIHVFGYTSEESRRIEAFEENNPEMKLDWILVERGFSKKMCLEAISAAGIALPVMYSLGFKNNNCIGCVKATSLAYWSKVRRLFPDVFERRCQQSRDLGVRLIRIKGERSFLDELPAMNDEPIVEDVSCGPQCELPTAYSS